MVTAQGNSFLRAASGEAPFRLPERFRGERFLVSVKPRYYPGRRQKSPVYGAWLSRK